MFLPSPTQPIDFIVLIPADLGFVHPPLYLLMAIKLKVFSGIYPSISPPCHNFLLDHLFGDGVELQPGDVLPIR
jgi:hypothetical protein